MKTFITILMMALPLNSFCQEMKNLPFRQKLKLTPLDHLAWTLNPMPVILDFLEKRYKEERETIEKNQGEDVESSLKKLSDNTRSTLMFIMYKPLLEDESRFVDYVDSEKPKLSDQQKKIYDILKKRKSENYFALELEKADKMSVEELIAALKLEHEQLWLKTKDEPSPATSPTP